MKKDEYETLHGIKGGITWTFTSQIKRSIVGPNRVRLIKNNPKISWVTAYYNDKRVILNAGKDPSWFKKDGMTKRHLRISTRIPLYEVRRKFISFILPNIKCVEDSMVCRDFGRL